MTLCHARVSRKAKQSLRLCDALRYPCARPLEIEKRREIKII